MHWCYQETEAVLALLALLPFIGIFFRKIHGWYHLKFNHKYCREYSVIDINHYPYNVQLFCCDISVANYSVEVHEDEILNFLTLLNLKKHGSINPVALLYRLSEAREKTVFMKQPIISGLFFILEKLIDHCIDYEVDIDYGIEERSV